MNDKLKNRIQQLKAEYEAGQKMMLELEAKQNSLRDTLLRISGAIQILEEMLIEEPENGSEKLNPDGLTPKPYASPSVDVSVK